MTVLAPARCTLLGAALVVLTTAFPGSHGAAAQPPPAADRVAHVRIVALNDFHGHLEPGTLTLDVPDPDDPARTLPLATGGAAALATLLARLRAEQPATVLVSVGDLVGASPLVSALFLDEPTIEVMERLGLAVHAVGNHEFDRGRAELLRLRDGGCETAATLPFVACARGPASYRGARFAWLAANVSTRDGTPLLAPAVVQQINGVRVGFIGAVTRSTAGIVARDGIRGLRFEDEAAAINRAAALLQAQGVHALVALLHEGGETDGGFDACERPRGAAFRIVAQLDPAIDAVFTAHTHRAYRCSIDGRPVLQAGSYGRLVAVLDLQIERASGRVLRTATRSANLPVPNERNTDPRLRAAFPPLPPDRALDALVADWAARAAPLGGRTVARIAASFDRRADAGGDHAMGRLLADAQLAATQSAGAQLALVNPGGIRAALSPRADGSVLWADLYTAQPFGNVLVTLTLSGADLLALLEGQFGRDTTSPRVLQPSRGFTYAWDAARPAGHRVLADSLRLHGAPVPLHARLRVTVNSGMLDRAGAARALRAAGDRAVGGGDLDALAAYLAAQSAAAPAAPDRAARITRLP